MAGRPVTSRASLTGVHYGMITFAVLTVLFAGLSVFLLTRIGRAGTTEKTAQQRMDFQGNPPSYYADEARARNTNVFAVVNDDLRKLAGLVTGEPNDLGATVLVKAERVVSKIADDKQGTINKGDTLVTAIRRLDELHTEERDRADDNQVVVDDLQAEVDALTAQLKSARDEFEAEVASLSERLRQSQEEKVNALQEKDQQLGDLQRELTAREQQIQKSKREVNQELRGRDVQIGRLENQVASLQKQIQALKPSSFDPSAILTKADGRILRAVPGSEVVYVNLGASDKIKVGMGFEVYSQTREVRETLRGKASLEVVTLMEDTAECRVTRRTPTRPIIEGDIVVNIAYEREREPKFVVRGEFDLDYDGIIDYDGIERVTGIIRQWGGQVAGDLDESVDFMVIGLAPKAPSFVPGAPVSDVVRDQARQKELEASQFRALAEQAQKMYIPVITQHQFLFLTGYAGNNTVVQR